MKTGLLSRFLGALALAGSFAAPVSANDLENSFDQLLGTQLRAPQVRSIAPQPVPLLPGPTTYASTFEAQLAALASPQMGRIGVSAVDLATGRNVQVLGSQPFPLASTSKIAIVATFLQGVDDGRYSLTDQYPLMVPVPSPKFSTSVAPVRKGTMLSALSLIELAITRSDNQATDALLAAVGGPGAVNRWVRNAGVTGFSLDRDIATLVRDDGAINPATTVDPRDSATPLAMTRLLAGFYRGEWLSQSSRSVLLGAMERCQTGKRRMRALLPEGTQIAHKTGTLSNTSSDVGIIRTPDGHAYAVAIYVTGQGGKVGRDSKIASLARVIYDGYQTESSSMRRTASR